MNTKAAISNTLQILSFPIVFLFGSLIIMFKIPGYGQMCDPDQVFLAFFGLIAIIALAVFCLSAFNDLSVNRQPRLRKTLLLIIGLQFILIFTVDPIYIFIKLGTLKTEIENDFPIIQLDLYNSGGFYYESYNASCSEEFMGQYTIDNDTLNLKFDNKDDYLTDKYLLTKDSIIPIDTTFKSFKIKKEPNNL